MLISHTVQVSVRSVKSVCRCIRNRTSLSDMYQLFVGLTIYVLFSCAYMVIFVDHGSFPVEPHSSTVALKKNSDLSERTLLSGEMKLLQALISPKHYTTTPI